MTLQEIQNLIESLQDVQDIQDVRDAESSHHGKTRYESEINGEKVIIELRNNAITGSSECYLKFGTFENIYTQGSSEFEVLSDFIMF